MAILADPIETPNNFELWVSDYSEAVRQEREFLKKLKEDLRAQEPGDLVGEILKWSRADGYAMYVVVREAPLTIAHVPLSDGYTIEAPLVRGLILEDVEEMVERDKAFRDIYARGD